MSKDRTLIAITAPCDGGRINIRDTYFGAVWNAGGIPSFLPYGTEYAEDYADAYDGLILSGGGDVEPSRYGEAKLCDKVRSSNDRDLSETAVFGAFFKRGKPILGICRGIQLLNVALGGSLFQDIPGHSQKKPYGVGTHTVDIFSGLRDIIGEKALVNSFHHQAIKRPAPGLTVEAVSCDGIIEAVTMPGYRYLRGIQWHPECMCGGDGKAERLFASFTEACRNR